MLSGFCLLQTVTTNVSCTDVDYCTTPEEFGNASAAAQRCAPDQLLPCFLMFTDYTVPREDASNMKCKAITRKPTKQATEDCAGPAPHGLGAEASLLPAVSSDRWMARWELDPSYYQFQSCECLLVSEGGREWEQVRVSQRIL